MTSPLRHAASFRAPGLALLLALVLALGLGFTAPLTGSADAAGPGRGNDPVPTDPPTEPTDPDPTDPPEPVDPVLPTVAEVDAGGQTTCRVTASGNAQCAGENTWGQIGVGDTRDRLRFTQVGLPGEWARISTSGSSTCGIKTTGDLYCWGMNSSGQLGIGDAGQMWTPQRVGAGVDWTSIDVGWTTACGIKAPGTLWCWGGNYNGQLGLGDKVARRVPAPIGEATDWASVSVGGWHVCALKTDGTAYCAGRNDLGQLGTGNVLGTVALTPVRTTAKFASVDAGWSTTCALSKAGQPRCWGLNDRGQLGDGTTTNKVVPTLVAAQGRTFAAVNLGDAHACALGVDGKVACWGSDRYGQLGTAAGTDSTTPVPVAGDVTYLGLDVGWLHSCGIGTGGSVQCWGNNEQGQLSSGSRIERPVPPGVRSRTVARRKQNRADGKLVLTSFNILGSQHTEPGGGTPHYAPGRMRTEWAGNLLRGKNADIVSFQELQHDQYNQLRSHPRRDLQLLSRGHHAEPEGRLAERHVAHQRVGLRRGRGRRRAGDRQDPPEPDRAAAQQGDRPGHLGLQRAQQLEATPASGRRSATRRSGSRSARSRSAASRRRR